MNWERLRVSTEIVVLRARARLRNVLTLLGVGMVTLAAWNLLGSTATTLPELLTAYRSALSIVVQYQSAVFVDIMLLTLGLAVILLASKLI